VCVRKCGKFDRTKPEENSVRCEVVHGQKLKKKSFKKMSSSKYMLGDQEIRA
jgi:hypothetical protein